MWLMDTGPKIRLWRSGTEKRLSLRFWSCRTLQVFIDHGSRNGCGRSSGVEHNLAKVRVVSSNLIARSISKQMKTKHYSENCGACLFSGQVFQAAFKVASVNGSLASTPVTAYPAVIGFNLLIAGVALISNMGRLLSRLATLGNASMAMYLIDFFFIAFNAVGFQKLVGSCGFGDDA